MYYNFDNNIYILKYYINEDKYETEKLNYKNIKKIYIVNNEN